MAVPGLSQWVNTIHMQHLFSLAETFGHIFYLWLKKVLSNERSCYICNIFSQWLRPCSGKDRKWAQVNCLCTDIGFQFSYPGHIMNSSYKRAWYIIRDNSGYGSANERRRYIVAPPLIGWAHTQNDPYTLYRHPLSHVYSCTHWTLNQSQPF